MSGYPPEKPHRKWPVEPEKESIALALVAATLLCFGLAFFLSRPTLGRAAKKTALERSERRRR